VTEPLKAEKTVLVTGGAGFIGSNLVLSLAQSPVQIVNLDKLTYAGNLQNLETLRSHQRHAFVHGDIGDRGLVSGLLTRWQPDAIINLAAESHVDRSIHGPGEFIQTNVVGTFHLLEETRGYWSNLTPERRARFRFLHVSTDEVYGSLSAKAAPFTEDSAYAPNSPYSASKAASDHLVRAYFRTYGLPTLTTNCSNNYGPFQFPEKLIPLIILNGTAGKPLPVYGTGTNVRDWLFVGDHCAAIRTVLDRGRLGETYAIGGESEKTNLDVVREVCALLDELHPGSPVTPHEKLITFVTDRPGHDHRYAIDASKMKTELGWRSVETFSSGLRRTVQWYLDHPGWVGNVTSGAYKKWLETNYSDRVLR
jgi:dTDP-glucose 4,6-dehydratase